MRNIKNGFTLIEMLLVMGIMSILLVILTEVFGSIINTKLRSEAVTAVAQDSRYVLARLAYDISRSSAITSPTGNTLALQIDGVSYVYQLDGSTLTLAVAGGDPQALTGVGTRITSLNFVRTDLGLNQGVQISMVMHPTMVIPGTPDLGRQITTTIGTR